MVDHAVFVDWCNMTLQSDTYLSVIQSALNEKAREDREEFSVPGCELVVDINVSSHR